MIRLITAQRLAALRAEAAQLPAVREHVATAQEQFRTAKAAHDEATTELRRLYDAVIVDLAEVKRLIDDPATGSAFQGDLALKVLRGQITKIKQTGDIKAINVLWLLDVLFSDDPATTGADGDDERLDQTRWLAEKVLRKQPEAT